MFKESYGYEQLSDRIKEIFVRKAPEGLAKSVQVKYEFLQSTTHMTVQGFWYDMDFKKNKTQVCWSGMVTPLVGNAQVGVSHAVYLHNSYQGMGIGGEIHKVRLDALRRYGKYNSLICTVNATNVKELAILRKNGWEMREAHKGLILCSIRLREGDSYDDCE